MDIYSPPPIRQEKLAATMGLVHQLDGIATRIELEGGSLGLRPK